MLFWSNVGDRGVTIIGGMVGVGSSLGPYEIVAPLGRGGMGEVFRGRDSRLGRDVAIKVLRSDVATDADSLRRFEAEARAASRLNHPNILAIYDVGIHEQSPYIVSELLDGETLRERIARGPVGLRHAIAYVAQVAHGLAAAHDKGLVHRDIKPENVFITRDDRVKILDFGIAKPADSAPTDPGLTRAMTGAAVMTEPGVIMGSVGYMSPEQVRAQGTDYRSDIFSVGVMFSEMLTGRPLFTGESAVETLNAILKDDPPEPTIQGESISPAVSRVLRRCLEKNPDARWRSAHDLAFAFEAVGGADARSPIADAAPPAAQNRTRWRMGLGLTAAVAAAILAAVFATRRVSVTAPPLAFHRLTFARGTIWSARFAPEGRTITYSASWDGKPVALFATRPDSPESRSLDIAGADVLSVSGAGEMALLLKPGSALEWGWKLGTLARAPLAGGAPRESLRGVQLADWSVDGASLAVVRAAGPGSRVEFPLNTVLYETPQRIGALRMSRQGDFIAFAERPPGVAGTWSIAIVDLRGRKTTISNGWTGDFIDLAWSPTGNEVWFTMRQGGEDGLHAATRDGRHRVVARLAAPLQLFDVSADGRVLAGRAYWRSGIIGFSPALSKEQDLSWLDASEADDLSWDGKALLTTEFGEGGGVGKGSVYLRRLDGSPAVRLGDGQAFSLSPDGTRALGLRRTNPPELVLWPTGAGEPIVIKNPGMNDYVWAEWMPDGKSIVFSGTEAGHGERCYIQAIAGGGPRAITPEGTAFVLGQKAISPDGQSIVAIGRDGVVSLFPIGGGTPTAIPGLEPADVPVRWSVDERSLFVFRKTDAIPRIYLVNLTTGANELWREIMPADLAGIVNVWSVHVGPDDRAYYYSYMRNLSDLYLIDGLK